MSTVPEIVAAHHCNMQILCLSLITNIVVAAGDGDESEDHGAVANHEEVLDAVEKRAIQVQQLVKKTVEIIGKEILPNLPDLPKVSLDVPASLLKTTLGSDGVDSESGISMSQVGFGVMLVAAGAVLGMTMSRKK